jgi:hypothetical protein
LLYFIEQIRHADAAEHVFKQHILGQAIASQSVGGPLVQAQSASTIFLKLINSAF